MANLASTPRTFGAARARWEDGHELSPEDTPGLTRVYVKKASRRTPSDVTTKRPGSGQWRLEAIPRTRACQGRSCESEMGECCGE